MSEQVRYVRLGAFVLVGTGLLLAAVLVLGAGLFSSGGIMIETYIDESVQGLDLGSPIKQRGVEIGTVTQIGFVRQLYNIPIDDPRYEAVGRYVVVRGRLRPLASTHLTEADLKSALNKIVPAGLRLKLATQGITGISYLEADYVDPVRSPALVPSWTPEYVYIPSTPSTIAKIGDAAQRVFDRLDRLDIEGVVAHLDALLVSLDATVREADLASLSKNGDKLLVELEATSTAVRRVAERTDVGTLQRNANQALAQLDRTLADASQVLTSNSAALDATLRSLRESAGNLEEATRTLRNYPSLLLLGEPPPRFEPPKRIQMMRALQLISALGAGLLVSACFSTARPYPVKQRFVLAEAREVPAAPRSGGPLLEVPPFAQGPRLAGRQLVYRTGDAEYVSDFYAEFWSAPGEIVADVTRRWLAGSGLFAGVLEPGSSVPAALALEGSISELYGDYRDPSAPKAVLALHVVLVDHRRAEPGILFQNDYRAEEAAATATPEALVAAWDTGLGHVLASLEADLRATIGQ